MATIDPQIWDLTGLTTRLGLIETLECAVAGPGNFLAKVRTMEPTGKRMAQFDWIKRNPDVTR